MPSDQLTEEIQEILEDYRDDYLGRQSAVKEIVEAFEADRWIRVPEGRKVLFVSDELIEQARQENWSRPQTVQVHVPKPDGLVIDPQFRYVSLELEHIRLEKEKAISEMRFEEAAQWRDQERELTKALSIS